jgi:hypothetical protein
VNESLVADVSLGVFICLVDEIGGGWLFVGDE